MGGFIPFPNVPDSPGVPAVPRLPGGGSSVARITLGAVGAVLARAALQTTEWGIFDQQGNQLGRKGITDFNFVDNVLNAAGIGSTLSTLSLDYVKETQISDYPIERGSFASYNKVEAPANPVVALALGGSTADRADFLNALDAACKSTDLYNVVSPEITYVGYSLERYAFRRSAERGARLIIVDVFLKEIRQVQASFTQAQTSVIVAPKSPSATPSVNSGKVQAPATDSSTLKKIATKLGF